MTVTWQRQTSRVGGGSGSYYSMSAVYARHHSTPPLIQYHSVPRQRPGSSRRIVGPDVDLPVGRRNKQQMLAVQFTSPTCTDSASRHRLSTTIFNPSRPQLVTSWHFLASIVAAAYTMTMTKIIIMRKRRKREQNLSHSSRSYLHSRPYQQGRAWTKLALTTPVQVAPVAWLFYYFIRTITNWRDGMMRSFALVLGPCISLRISVDL